jgi:tRNA pseudouridine38-40 synthase
MPSQRYKLIVSYRGTNYHGWQTQSVTKFYKGPVLSDGRGIPTIQALLSRAIVSVVHHPIRLVGSSRTDARVHAKGQIARFDSDQVQIPTEGMRCAINAALPDDIQVRSIELVPEWFDTSVSTISKRYQYAIWNHTSRPTFFPDLAWHRWQELDLGAMKEAAARLVGEHDFASFARPGHGRENTVRTVLSCEVARRGNLVVIGVEGGGFLWNMVRIIVGTLVGVGIGKWQPADIDEMLAAKDRRSAGLTAPPHGLYLQWIKLQPPDPTALPAPSE